MKSLRISTFGIRGFVGESLSPNIVMNYAAAFGTFIEGGRVLLGRDTRYSSDMIHNAALSSLLSAGCEVLDCGICPTPILQYAVQPYKATGAVAISGGHNGMGWNAVTLIGEDGALLEPEGAENVLEYYHAGQFMQRDWLHQGTCREPRNFSMRYFEALTNFLQVDAIRKVGFKVLIDPVAGAGCAYLKPFAEHLGFSLVAINASPSGYLPRETEPRPRSALGLASMIRHVQGDVGFVFSSDMNRMSIVTEEAEPGSEEFTFAVIADHVLSTRKGVVVTNCCTTRMIDDIARRHGVPLVKTAVGQAYILSKLADEQGVIGGEGSGSTAVPAFSKAFDGFLMMGLVLEAMAVNQCAASDLLRRVRRYHIVKKHVRCSGGEGYHALDDVENGLKRLQPSCIDYTDGVRADWSTGWIHVRASRTEPLVRIISEDIQQEAAQDRAEKMIRIIQRQLA